MLDSEDRLKSQLGHFAAVCLEQATQLLQAEGLQIQSGDGDNPYFPGWYFPGME